MATQGRLEPELQNRLDVARMQQVGDMDTGSRDRPASERGTHMHTRGPRAKALT